MGYGFRKTRTISLRLFLNETIYTVRNRLLSKINYSLYDINNNNNNTSYNSSSMQFPK